MRLILTILFFSFLSANAQTNYYVSNAGNDGNAGTSGSPFATINHALSVSVNGDTINLNKGDSWNEKITIPSSVYIRAYGTGNKPLITGFQTATMTNAGGNIWTSTISTPVSNGNLNVVTVNGNIGYKARYPNTGYLTPTALLSTTQIKITHTATDYTGKGIAVFSAAWVLDTSRVLQQKTGVTYDTLVLSPAITYGTGTGKYFFQNDASYLDTTNEWSYTPSTGLLSVYATSIPTVQYSTIDTVVNIHKVSNVTFDGVKFTGANMMAISADSLRYDTAKNCSFNNNNTSVYLLCTKGFGIKNDSLLNNLNIAYHSDPDTSFYVYGNYIKNTGIIAGMGGNGYSTYISGYSNGSYAKIIANTVLKSGYHGIRFQGQFDSCYYNRIDSFNMTKDDGGGIYMVGGNSIPLMDSGSIILNNIVSNGLSATQACPVYLDDYTQSVTVKGNTVWGGVFADIFTKGSYNKILYNTVKDSLTPPYYALNGGNYSFIGNVLFSNNTSSYLAFFPSGITFTSIDSNYYIFPIAPSREINYSSTLYSLSGWQAANPTYDIHSNDQLRFGVTSYTPILVYNPTLSDSTVTLSGGYYDVAGNGYYGSITLGAFQSALLFPSVYQAPTFIYRVQQIKVQ